MACSFFFSLASLLSNVAHAQPAGVHADHLARFGAPGHERVGPRAPQDPPPPPTGGPAVTVYGYHPYWGDDPTGLDFDRLSHLAIFAVSLGSDGSISGTSHWTDVAPDVVPLAHSYGVKVHLCVISFDGAVHAAVLPDPERRATATAELAALVEEAGADGVNVDVEAMDAAYSDDLVSWVEELSEAAGEVVIATPAVDWQGAYDYDRLAAASTGLFIMGYGYHWSGGDPGPVDPLFGGDPWSSYSLEWSVEDYLYYGAPADKIIVGLPLYGYEWPTSSDAVPGDATDSGDALFMTSAVERAESVGRRYDEVTHTPYALPDGSQLWYSDTDSVRERIAWTVGQGLQGVGFWALTYEGGDPAFWDMVEEETGPSGPEPDTGDTGDSGDSGSGGGEPPVALAGEPIVAYPGDTVRLNGSGSSDPEGAELTYAWTQTAGPPAELEGPTTAEPQFTAGESGTLVFELVVSDGSLDSDPDAVDVVVVDPAAGQRIEIEDGCGCGSVPAAPAGAGLALAAAAGARRRRRRA